MFFDDNGGQPSLLGTLIEYQKILDVNFYTHVAPRTVPYLDENLSDDAL